MPAELHGDQTRLKQALLNYAGNAIKFTERGSIHLQASVLEDTPTSVLLRFEVRDTGIGIASDNRDKLFSAFEQGDNTLSRQYGGTGLGLVITKKLAQAMGGDAGVLSTLGVGSSFWFTARLCKGTLATIDIQTPPGRSAEDILKQNHRGKRVLLAEDDLFNQEVGRILLEDVGLIVELAADGNAALTLAAHQHYDLIFMDMQMPHLDGLEATRQLRQLADCRTVPIIAMTANAFAEDRKRCLLAGMNDFITKPVDPAVLYDVILRWLQEPAVEGAARTA
jgi:CheY-like chemotaxis protein